MSPVLVTLTSRSDSDFELLNISLKESTAKRHGVDLNSNGLDYCCVQKSEGRKNSMVFGRLIFTAVISFSFVTFDFGQGEL